MTPEVTVRDLHRARMAIYLSFIINGMAWGSFIPRIPDVKAMFHLSNGQLGTSLLAGSLGVLVAMKPAGALTARWGSARTMIVLTIVMSGAMLLVSSLLNYTWFVVTLFFTGIVMATHDIAMNTHGTTVEKLSEKSLMNGFHARFSLGGLAGAAYGGVCSQLEVKPLYQMTVIALALLAAVPWLKSALLPTTADPHSIERKPKSERERQVIFYVLGLLGFFSSVCEGSASDWGGVLLRDTWGAAPFISSIPYIIFSATMLLGRLVGDKVTDRMGREWIVKYGGGTAGVGLLIGLLIGKPLGISIGWALLGLGVSVAIPSVFSASSELADAKFAGHISPSAAVAIVGSVSYAGFLLGPPIIGWLADQVTLRWAMLLPATFAIAMAASSRIVRVR